MKVDMIGKRFGRLTVIAQHPTKKGTNTYWICRCDCGSITKPIFAPSLTLGRTKSCGCIHREGLVARNTIHGKCNTKLHGVWACMKQRCENPNNQKYKDYGGRGITVYEEWKHSFQAFYDYVSTLPHFGEKGYSLDRINNDGNYEPGNVRWATAKEQIHNRRDST